MKQEQRPYADESHELENSSPRRVPLECNVRPHLASGKSWLMISAQFRSVKSEPG